MDTQRLTDDLRRMSWHSTILLKEEPSEENSFCSPANLDASANYVNILLTTYGYPVPLNFKSNDPNDACKVVNCLYQVLKDKKEERRQRDDMEEAIARYKQEQYNMQAELDKRSQELASSRRENSHLQNKLKAADQELKNEIASHRFVKDELSRLKNNMQYMKSQYAHETRRHEQEHAKTRETLFKLMNGKHTATLSSLTLNEPLPTHVLGMEENGVQEEGMYADLLSKSSNREQEARIESDRTARLLADVYSTIVSLLETVSTLNKTPSVDQDSDNLDIFRLPVDIGSAAAVERIHGLLDKLKQEWKEQVSKRTVYKPEDMNAKDDIIAQLEQTNDELVEALQDCTTEYEEKAKMYMRFADGHFFDLQRPRPAQQDELSDSEDSVLDDPREESKYRRIQKQAIAERRRVTEAAIKLGEERTKLAAERWALEEVKRQQTLKEILSDSEPSPLEESQTRNPNIRRAERPLARTSKRLRSFLGHAPSQ
ncbi:Afadin and alpha-actinin-binding-domain-containing protein [Syncephalastrum racemosum]|uniref:Afadin and alpha-actinin-binding-domain-containing protein n=1 Tax=Syncephalastrum racemosum TaxID=13706 RepID=A0A1X2HBX2_SYNRA|nr:Afadin and alpha-actinin-binding-domain-containing protein [Syncephalastrum racemosum]